MSAPPARERTRTPGRTSYCARDHTPSPRPGYRYRADPRVICVDVEPDEIDVPLRERRPWIGFELMQPLMTRLRTSLAAATGRPVRFAWFLRMDPQIEVAYGSPTWGVDRYRAQIDDLLAAGDAIGIHPHAWRWVPEAGTWRADHGDAAWVAHCVDMSLDAFASTFGQPCRDSVMATGGWITPRWPGLPRLGSGAT